MSQDVNRLKALLFENESRALSDLNRRMDIVFEQAGTTERFTSSVASVLDAALLQAEVERHSEVSRAIAPLIVQTIKTEIRGSQDELAEALYPAMGRMVTAYVISAIRDLMDEINRRLESNPFMLRLRSILTGRPVVELAFVEGQRLRVDELYLIRRGLGQLVGHWPAGNGPAPQDQRVSGILTAINEVANEAFDADKASLRRIDLGTSIVYLRASPTHLLAARCRGVAPLSVERFIDARFLSTIGRLRTLYNGGAEGGAHSGADLGVPSRAVNMLLAGLASDLEDGIGEQHTKLAKHRTGLSPAAVLVWAIALSLAGWLAWAGYAGYQTARVRAIAADVLGKEPELAGYPVHAVVERRGRDVALSGLVPTTAAGQTALKSLRAALPQSDVVDRTTALPSGLDEARADIATLQSDVSQVRAESADADAALRTQFTQLGAALSERIAGLEMSVTQADQGLHTELKALAADLAKANADSASGLGGLRHALSQAEAARRADVGALREEIARAVALTPRQQLAAWIDANALFFVKDTDYRDPQTAAADLDQLAQLIKATDVLVRVVGYTDEKGGEKRNTPLSQARAEKVIADLVARGIPASRLTGVGRNDSADLNPMVGDASPNRRVEFEIGFASEGAP
jgi:outer membrane protein OmpA-like peptidoglycan-associated protein